jgi:hypothetical protein
VSVHGRTGRVAVIGEPVNRVLKVDLDGEEVTLSLYA